jgi:hypothetical protein
MFALIWKGEISFGDLLTIVGFMLTLAGLVFAGWQLLQNGRQFRQNGRVERARFLVEMENGLLADRRVEDVFYNILQGEFQFNRNRELPQEEMRAIDSLLSQYNLIGLLLRMGIIEQEDVEFFKAGACVVLMNANVQEYERWANELPNTPNEGWWPAARYLRERLCQRRPGGEPS